MIIDIKDIQGQTRVSAPIQEGAKGIFSLMNSDYIQLSFSSETVIPFKLGDYADLSGIEYEGLGGKVAKIYEIVDMANVNPTYNDNTGAYDYNIRLDAYYWKWKNKIFKYTPENAGQEASWSLTAALDVHLGVLLRNLKALGYTYKGSDFIFEIDSTVENKAVSVTYDNTNLLDALFMLASKEYYNCDCWVTDNVIHFGRNEFGDAVKIERGVEAVSIGKAESKGTYATRIYAFGGTRNIPTNYRPTDEQMVVNGVVQKRLMLPVGTPYIDAYPAMTTEEAIEDVVVFDDIYPRRIGTMSSVTPVDRDIVDGGEVVGTFKAYQYKDTGLIFDTKYLIDGQELKIRFQSGKLNGLEFVVQFNPNGKDPAEQLWEIIRNEDYGRPLPDDILRPEDDDTYVLSGFNIQLVSDTYIPDAEKELLARAQKYADMAKKDDGTYPVTLFSDYVYADQLKRNYEFGQKVNLIDKAYFPEGRISRILGWEIKLDIPFDSPKYTVGESAQYSRLGEIEDKLDALTYKGQTYVGGSGGSGVYVIKTNDSTAPSNSNVFSALRSLATLIRKDKADTMPYLLTLLKGAVFGNSASIDEKGIITAIKAILENIVISEDIKSDNFLAGALGTGYALLKRDADGKSYLEVDKLFARVKAIFAVLEIMKLTYTGGNFVFSPAGMKCIKVEEYDNYYRCFFTADDGEKSVENTFEVDDIVQLREFNVKTGVYENVANRYFWRRCIAKGSDYIDLSKTDRDMTSDDAPMAGDDLVTIGNKTIASRQNVIIISVYGEGSPSIIQYEGINTYSLDGKAKTVISPNGNKFTGSFLFTSGNSIEDELQNINDRIDGIGSVDAIYRIDLTNEISGVAADFDGTVTGELPYTDINVFAGNKADSGWVFSAEYKGCEGNIEGSRLTITALTEDTATATITATKEGVSTTLTATMNIYKVRASGGPAPVVKVTANSLVIKITTGDDGSVTYFPESIKLTAKLTNTEGVTWYIYLNNVWIKSDYTEDVYEIPSEELSAFISYSGGSLTIRCQSGEVYDDITIYNIQDGADGTNGTDGEDAYTIILDNESHTFAGDKTSALAGSTICGITAYVGATQKAVTIGSLTNVPVGMSYQINNNGTTSANILFMVDETMTTKNGVVDIPVTVEGKTFTKGFSYALSLQGEDGEPAVIYSIIPSVNQIVKSFDGTIKPTTVSCTKYKTVGDKTTATDEKTLRYKREGVDSSEQLYTGAVTVTSKTTSVVFALYDGSTMLDKETVPVLVDADGVLEESKIYADSVIEATKDNILLNTFKWIQGGRNLITNTYKPYTVVGNGKTNQTFTNWDILPECKGKSIVTAFKINLTGCAFQSGSRVIFQAYDTYGWNYQIFSSKNISANGDYEVVGIITAPSSLTGLAPVYIRLDYITGGKVTISDMRAYLSDSTEPLLPWEPCPNDLIGFDSRIELNKDSISLKVQELVTGRGSNILYNSSFSIDTKGWSGYNDNNIDYKFGSPCLVMTQSTTLAKFLTQKVGNRIINKSEGTKYTISFDICKPSTLTTLNVMLYAGGTIYPEDEAEAIDLSEIPNYTWTRVSKTQTIKSESDCEYLVFGNRTGGTSQGTYYIKNVQLEYGDTATPWKESYGGLLATGIDIQNGKIVFTADNTVIQSNDGTQIAMFAVDANGKPVIKGENIDVDNLKVRYLETSVERYAERKDKIVIDAETNTFKMLIKDTSSDRNVFDLMFTEDPSYGTIADMLFNRYDGSTLAGRTQINQNAFLIESYLRNKVSHASKITSEYILLQNNNVDDSSGTVQDSIKLSASTGLTITDRNTAKSYNGKTQSIYVTTSDGPFFMNFYCGFFVGMSPTAWFSTSN